MSNSYKYGKLQKKILIQGEITILTGLHIGGSNVGFAIGGADNTVVRNPLSQEPYIPGSSLKGKMRSLLEKLEKKFSKSGITHAGPYVDDHEDDICKIFGTTPESIKKSVEKKHGKDSYKPSEHDRPVSRLIVRDCPLTRESFHKLLNLKSTEMPYTEVKTEVVIDRITSSATPRQLERVPAGVVFEMKMVLNIFEGDDEKIYLDKIFGALSLIESDYLGGKGTRGSGEVKISIHQPLKFKDKKVFENNEDWQDYLKPEIKVPGQFLKNAGKA